MKLIKTLAPGDRSSLMICVGKRQGHKHKHRYLITLHPLQNISTTHFHSSNKLSAKDRTRLKSKEGETLQDATQTV